LWFSKENENKNKLHTLEELKQNIQLCISRITEKTLQQVAGKTRENRSTHALQSMVDIPNI
jgi:hypothetical protein